MIYKSSETEKNAAMRVAELMSACARTAPKACGIDAVESMVLDGAEKEKLTAIMRQVGSETERPFFARDAGSVDMSHCIVLIGTKVEPRGLNCALCGIDTCAAASKDGIPCALAVHDLGIAVGSSAATAMDHRMDNRILFTAGIAAMRMKLFADDVKMCFGIPLATTGKNIFFDRS